MASNKRFLFAILLAVNVALLFLYKKNPESIYTQAQQAKNYARDLALDSRENATFVTLCRNDDLNGLMDTIRSVEDRFNRNYHYDWVFLNEGEFSEKFKSIISNLISGEAKFGKVPESMWGYPDFIDQERAAAGRQKLVDHNIIYGGSESYRHMCRFESGFFYMHPLMLDYKYYWRVEPDTQLFCDINYDPFRYMRVNGKRYGFTIALYEFYETIESLWESTLKFLASFPEYVHPRNLARFISEDGGVNYNRCHFWSNFEIADADFWRGEAYSSYFKFLDHMGGFFYERWGDAPVHTIGAALFMDRDEIHFFDDIGYMHPPYYHVPESFVERGLKCSVDPEKSFDWTGYSCLRHYFAAQDLEVPLGVDQVRF